MTEAADRQSGFLATDSVNPHSASVDEGWGSVDWTERWTVLPPSVTQAAGALARCVDQGSVHSEQVEEAAAAFLGALHGAGSDSLESLSIQRLLLDDTHPYIQQAGLGLDPGPSLHRLFARDLSLLQQFARTPWWQWLQSMGLSWIPAATPVTSSAEGPGDGEVAGMLPWDSRRDVERLTRSLAQTADWTELIDELASFWKRYGSGEHHGVAAYRFGEQEGRNVGLQPIHAFDHFPLDWLQFEGPRVSLLAQNTRALLDGAEASNALIWGPRGCGKSTLIRALISQHWEEGLRAIEIPPSSYEHLPALYGLVRQRPERFVAVLDNIAIDSQDRSHRCLATILDGSLERRPPNLVFYATSNYKDLVDRHGERPDGPPPQQADAARAVLPGGATEPALAAYDPQGLQRLDERRALDDRFALKIYIDLPTKTQYEQILLAYANRAGLGGASQELLADFRVWCMRHNHDLVGGRTVRDYVQYRLALRSVEGPR